jgi:transglutaminase-like putative cysteine protease
MRGYVQQWLPMPYPALSVTVNGDWRYEPEGRTLVGAQNQNAGGLTYTVDSEALKPTIDQLRAAGQPPSDIARTYLSLPKNFPPVIVADARQVTAKATTPYDKAVALQNWFTTTGGFTYDTTVKDDTSSNAMVDFLRNRKGFCVHFAGTMAAMARSLGIPARVAIGFTPGEQQADGSWKVGTKNAHAWPELYFSGVGWLRFEPTPHVGFTPDYTVATTSGGTSAPSTAPTQTSTSAGPTASTSAGCPAQERRAGFCGQDSATGATGLDSASSWPTPLELTGLVVAGLLILLLLTPMLWRLRARSRRLRRRGARGPGGSGPPGGSSASQRGGGLELSDRQVLSIWREMIDSAWDVGIPPDEAETPRRTVARIVELGALEEKPRAAAGRLALATEQVLYAPRSDSTTALRQDVRAVRHGLRASARPSVRIRAVLFPPSSARLVRGLRETWQSLADRVRVRRRRVEDSEEQ